VGEEQISFGSFRCDPSNACIWRDEQALNLTPKAFEVLLYLLRHPGRLVSKEELLNAVWSETYVGDAVLKVSVGEIRKVLTDDPKTPRFIETVHRRGYRFIAPLTATPPPLSLESRVQSLESENQSAPPHMVRTLDARRQTPDVSTRSPTPNTQRPTPTLVGREAELAHLHLLLSQVLNGERKVVFVTGEPGIGKTALIEDFLTQIAENELFVARGQCLEHYGSSEAYLPVLEAFGELCRKPGRERVVGLLERYAPTWLIQMPALVNPMERERLRRARSWALPQSACCERWRRRLRY
jgi:DNA-binding winged helix-turn-helix (wHTH) protein